MRDENWWRSIILISHSAFFARTRRECIKCGKRWRRRRRWGRQARSICRAATSFARKKILRQPRQAKNVSATSGWPILRTFPVECTLLTQVNLGTCRRRQVAAPTLVRRKIKRHEDVVRIRASLVLYRLFNFLSKIIEYSKLLFFTVNFKLIF